MCCSCVLCVNPCNLTWTEAVVVRLPTVSTGHCHEWSHIVSCIALHVQYQGFGYHLFLGLDCNPRNTTTEAEAVELVQLSGRVGKAA